MTTVLAGAALDAFRQQQLSGDALLGHLLQHDGKVVVRVGVGVGKSVALDNTVEAAVASGQYDLVVVLCPTRRTLSERRWVKVKPVDVDVRVLKPRPSQRCGDLDEPWGRYERKGLTILGRASLCGSCPRLQGCFWPTQYGASLSGAKVIFATQAHFNRDPTFIDSLATWAGADQVLVLIDENDLVLSTYERRIEVHDLTLFTQTLLQLPVNGEPWAACHQAWIDQARRLIAASQDDLYTPSWRMPAIRGDWAYRVQQFGFDQHGDAFRFLAYELTAFGRSAAATRECIARAGYIRFTQKPLINSHVILFSASCDPSFTKFRTGLDLFDPFADYRFKHAETRWHNIASSLSAQRNFSSNADQIVDFFAQLVLRRHGEGKRCLLVSKKRLLRTCAARLQREFCAAGGRLKIITDGWTPRKLADPNVVPLIRYGMIGTNLFEHFDAAYCLNSFNISEEILGGVLHDLSRSDCQVPVKIFYEQTPHRRRRAGVVNETDRFYDVAHMADVALRHKEMDVVIQAVGRVRPHTWPREIVLFQCGEHPDAPYDHEFDSLAAARRHFGILTNRERVTLAGYQQVAAARAAGLTKVQVAARIGSSLRTVQRKWDPPPTL